MSEYEVPKEVKMAAMKDQLISSLGDQLHNEWRASRKLDDGSFEPRIKETKDSSWAEKSGTNQVDIANTEYSDLPNDWQQENKASAEIAVEEIYKAANEKIELDEEFIEHASEAIHNAWRDRNESWAPKEQMLDYQELTEEEKEKDRVIIKKAIELFNQNMNS